MRLLCVLLATLGAAGCGLAGPTQFTTLHSYPLDSAEGVIAKSGVDFDAAQSADGNGSLRITTTEPVTVRLFETGDVDIEDGVVRYAAKIRTEGLEGRAYLEMWAVLPQGEFFSRALDQPLTGSNEWTSQQTPFFLQAGQNPLNLKLNVVIEGRGTVWVDAVEVTAGT